MTMAYSWPGELAPDMYAPAYAPAASEAPVCDVWQWNLAQQMAILRQLVDQYRYITVDCKFPGLVARPIGTFHSTSEYHYQCLRTNVDMLKVVQVGFTLTDGAGNVPPGSHGTWQFNFKFDPHNDMCSAEGVEILHQSGLDFAKHDKEGIHPFEFAELLLSSGLVLNEQVTWISFHSGYDLGYLVALMLNKAVPVEKTTYLDLLRLYFPNVFDVKFIIKKYSFSEKNVLHEVAQEIGLYRGSSFCLAGPDSRLVALCFFELLRTLGDNTTRVAKNLIFGLEEEKKDEDETAYGFNPPAGPRPMYAYRR